jgi:Mrp family chromosome partitioning ATPase
LSPAILHRNAEERAMGRILDALKPSGKPVRTSDPVGTPVPADPPAPAAGDTSGEIPYIEVGGPGTSIEASPRVLAGGAKRSQAVPLGKTPPSATWSSPDRAPSSGFGASSVVVGPVGITYQPSPGILALHGPAEKRLAPSLIAYHQPDHPISGQYRSALAALVAHLPGSAPHVLLLAAPAQGTGTTTVLLNLALTRAKQGQQRVAVVDANLRRPGVAGQLGLSPTPGMRDVVARSASLTRALQESGQPDLLVLPAGEAVPAGGAWPAAAELRAVLHQLRDHFDWVLVDVPSWDDGPELVALCSACDAVYLVVRPADLGTSVLRELERLIPHLGSSLGGYILTQR